MSSLPVKTLAAAMLAAFALAAPPVSASDAVPGGDALLGNQVRVQTRVIASQARQSAKTGVQPTAAQRAGETSGTVGTNGKDTTKERR